MVQVTNTNTNTARNASNIGADVFHLATIKDELKSGPIMLAHTYPAELTSLLARITSSKDGEDSIRGMLLEYWHATPEGDTHKKRYDQLVALGKLKTAEQKTEQATMLLQQNNVAIMLQRAVETFQGIDLLRKAQRDVTVTRIHNQQNAFACYVYRTATGEGEWIRFSAEQLRNVASATFDNDTKVSDIRIACSSAKNGAANKDKGTNGERIAPSKIADAVTAIDTSLAPLYKDDGSLAVPPGGMKALHRLWAQLDAVMSDNDKAKARGEYKAEGDKADAAIAKVIKPKAKRKSA